MIPHYTYILKSINYPKTYVGISGDIDSRLIEHNAGKTKSTKSFAPYVILYFEVFNTRIEARNREKYLKSGAGRAWIKRKFFTEKD